MMYQKSRLGLSLCVLLLCACQPADTPKDNGQATAQTTQTTTTSTPNAQHADDHSHAFDNEIRAYQAWAIAEVDSLAKESATMVAHIKAGELDKAKAAYLTARVHFERIEPIAEQFGEFDAAIDRREADLEAGETWRGFHAIEKELWAGNINVGSLGDTLLADINSLKNNVGNAQLNAKGLIEGAVDLLNEVATSKITGEEEIFSKSDLNVFAANVDGAKKIYELFKEHLNATLSADIDKQFLAVETALAKHKTDTGYQSYDSLSQDEIRVLAESISKLGEPLAKMGHLFDDNNQ